MSLGTLYLPQVWAGSQLSHKLLPSTIRPLSAHVKLTENCQAKCISCDYWKKRWEDGLNTPRAIDLVNQIADLGIGALRFTGGEPLLRRDFFEVLQKSRSSEFKRIVLQTNGLLLKKLHKEINDSPISHISVSVDGLKATNDLIRGIRGYFDLAMEGIQLMRNKQMSIAITMNKISAAELCALADVARGLGAGIDLNILSRSLFFLADADIASMWPEQKDIVEIVKFLREKAKRPNYEIDYVSRYYNNEKMDEPPCVLGYLQVFVLSNGDVLTGCYPLPPVGNVLKDSLASILRSEAYLKQSMAMLRRECPGCTCGIESSLAMKHAASSAFYELGKLTHRPDAPSRPVSSTPQQKESETVRVG
ncbi:MAG: radical SAM protein [Candidatus Acidiferrum sp.]